LAVTLATAGIPTLTAASHWPPILSGDGDSCGATRVDQRTVNARRLSVVGQF
jgi:hypothetical protein